MTHPARWPALWISGAVFFAFAVSFDRDVQAADASKPAPSEQAAEQPADAAKPASANHAEATNDERKKADPNKAKPPGAAPPADAAPTGEAQGEASPPKADKPKPKPAKDADKKNKKEEPDSPKPAPGNRGQADLDAATEAKLAASTLSDLGEVVRLCRSALKKGLSEDNRLFAEQLLAATLFQRGTHVAKTI
jgi:outer membrane biosynthesis protein TonB